MSAAYTVSDLMRITKTKRHHEVALQVNRKKQKEATPAEEWRDDSRNYRQCYLLLEERGTLLLRQTGTNLNLTVVFDFAG